PVELTCVAHRAVEHPKGLGESEAASTSGGDRYFQSMVTAPGQQPQDETQVVASGWNYPNLYQMIEASGQKVVASTVLKVFAQDENWTDTTLTVSPGQRLWFDFKSDGFWDVGEGMNSVSYQFLRYSNLSGRMVDADGYVGYYADDRDSAVNVNIGSLAGRVGAGEKFHVGTFKRDYEPLSTGPLTLQMTDIPGEYADNNGFVTVRIAVTEAQ
ncbi:MAG TPA: hypothetical protein V6D17_17960, partial [Candidatus Obscuribacterales bacterium]